MTGLDELLPRALYDVLLSGQKKHPHKKLNQFCDELYEYYKTSVRILILDCLSHEWYLFVLSDRAGEWLDLGNSRYSLGLQLPSGLSKCDHLVRFYFGSTRAYTK